ncbi:hypothetical protein BFP76_01545 [Amylibacter kogurei]|uniref:Peptidase M50 domain-containing protein n=1 Tax=Paramylibacter kogurei TaxID=1889778 RepID=A0A2G5K3J2_9RHOB|nr:site-2 protease family protein [Amylibacter kogurei]PIB23965.1 hypothetical protein BFP76_01545 [Amylibacter kogurei]
MEIAAALGICVVTYFILRGGWTAGNRAMAFEASPDALVMGALAVAGAVYFIGAYAGAALIVTVIIHEFGHVAAYRVAGHDDARFRLVPLMGGVAISNRLPDSPLKDFYISLLGPAICIAPTLLALFISPYAYQIYPPAGYFLWVFASFSGALNFFNLLPLWPLDGGRCTRILALALAPKYANAITITMGIALAALALYLRAYLLLGFALIALPSALQPVHYAVVRPMRKSHALIALAAYLVTAAFFLFAGFSFLANWL